MARVHGTGPAARAWWGSVSSILIAFLLSDPAHAQPPPLLGTWGEPGTADGQLDSPLRIDALAPDSIGFPAGWILVVDGPAGARRVQRFEVDGAFVRSYGTSLVDPAAVTFVEDATGATSGRIAVLDAGADEIRVLDGDTGGILDQWSVAAVDDGDLDFDPATRTFWVCLTDQHVVQQFSFDGDLLLTIGGLGTPGTGAEEFDTPRSVGARAGRVVVADTANDRVVTLWEDAAGSLVWAAGGTTGSGPGEFDEPWAVSADCNGRVLVADRGNARVQRMTVEDSDPTPGVYAPVLMPDELWFDDGMTFSDLIDLVDPAGPGAVVGLPDDGAPPLRREINGSGVHGLVALDRAWSRVSHFEDLCCLGGWLDPHLFSITSNGGNLLVSPGGTGPRLADIGATVSITMVDPCGEPVVGFPAQDIWLDTAGTSEIALCSDGSTADANTDAAGQTTISRALAAGGWSQAGLHVFFSGMATYQTLPILVASPDLDGDLEVDLADVGLFAEDFSGTYAFRSDLNFDGTISLGDIGEFAVHLGEQCP